MLRVLVDSVSYETACRGRWESRCRASRKRSATVRIPQSAIGSLGASCARAPRRRRRPAGVRDVQRRTRGRASAPREPLSRRCLSLRALERFFSAASEKKYKASPSPSARGRISADRRQWETADTDPTGLLLQARGRPSLALYPSPAADRSLWPDSWNGGRGHPVLREMERSEALLVNRAAAGAILHRAMTRLKWSASSAQHWRGLSGARSLARDQTVYEQNERAGL